MTVSTLAIRANAAPAQGAIPSSHFSALLGAYNAATLASAYLERGNLKAARRKLVLALRDVDTLAAASTSEGGAA